MKTNPEQNLALGKVIRRHRKGLNRTQEEFAEMAGLNVRTVQRAEAGRGLSCDGLKAIASALNLDERDLVKESTFASASEPQVRIALNGVSCPERLVEVLADSVAKNFSFEIAPADEHEFNEELGQHVLYLLDEIERSKEKFSEHAKFAKQALGLCMSMGFQLFVGNYVEKIPTANGSKSKTVTLVIAAAIHDVRITKVSNGNQLDVVRDSRRLLFSRQLGQPSTFYDWMNDQLISNSKGKENVRDALKQRANLTKQKHKVP